MKKAQSKLLKEIAYFWGKYEKLVDKRNNLVKARNAKKTKKHNKNRPNSIRQPSGLEEKQKTTIRGFLEFLNEKA